LIEWHVELGQSRLYPILKMKFFVLPRFAMDKDVTIACFNNEAKEIGYG